MLQQIKAPVTSDIGYIEIGTAVEISGIVYTARDAIIPKISTLIKNGEIDKLPVSLQGAVIMRDSLFEIARLFEFQGKAPVALDQHIDYLLSAVGQVFGAQLFQFGNGLIPFPTFVVSLAVLKQDLGDGNDDNLRRRGWQRGRRGRGSGGG